MKWNETNRNKTNRKIVCLVFILLIFYNSVLIEINSNKWQTENAFLESPQGKKKRNKERNLAKQKNKTKNK